ncbi:MAG TPA: putative Ig domain-containing protein, partial [Chryseolinea sp.]|nr:putative Ig domain-containing protein [Chryseolinea sp.]
MKTFSFLRRYIIAFVLIARTFAAWAYTSLTNRVNSISRALYDVLCTTQLRNVDRRSRPWRIILLVSSLSGVFMSPARAQFTPTLYRALNLNGTATTIDGNNWEASSGAANFNYTQTGGGAFENQSIPLVPSTDVNRTAMIRSSVWGNPLNLNVTAVPNGSYDVYLYTWADENPTRFSATLEGVMIVSAFESSGAGSWNKLGPFRTSITDGAINLTLSGGDAVVSGLEIWTAPNPPVVSNPLTDQVITTGQSYTYTVPSNAFTDPDAGTTLTYAASLASGSALPSWLTFNASTRAFSGTPQTANAAALNVKVTVSDGTGGSASDVFLLTINTGIYNLYRAINLNGSSLSIDGNTWEASSGAANLSITNNGVFSAPTVLLSPPTDANRATMIRSSVWGSLNVAMGSMPAGNYAIWVYTWEDNAPITFSFTLEGTAAVTNHNSGAAGTWSKLGPFLRTVSDGTLNLNVTGPDANLSGIEVYRVNTAPVVATPIPDQTATAGQPISYPFPANTFTDVDAGTTLTYAATLSNGNPLPSWLTFTPGTRTFSGTPGTGNVGVVDIRVTASDGSGGTVNDTFQLTINPPPFTPTLYRALNLNGPATTIDGNSWQASTGAANFNYTQTGGGAFENQSIPLVPSTDANRT